MSRCNDRLREYWHSLPGGPDAIFDAVRYGNVQVIATKGAVDDWAAYIGTTDMRDIAAYGDKLPEKVARAIFDQPITDCGEYRY